MAYVARPIHFQMAVSPHRAPAKTGDGRGILCRLYDSIMDSHQRQVDRDIAAFLARRGHRLTDSIERELDAHMINGRWQSRR